MTEEKTTALAKPYDIVNSVAATLRKYEETGQLILPANYSIENALKSAFLILQETVDKDKRSVLQSCNQASIANALLDMAVQGLNPGKHQCYFIAYGQKLICQRSYFGTMAVAERVAGAKDIWAEVVFQGDEFEYSISHGQKAITKHTQKVENINPLGIIAAYCVIEFGNDKSSYTEIMTIDQIHQSWAKSRMDPSTPTSTHTQFPEEMCKRTVINRACKKIINSSSDDNLFLQSFHAADDEVAEAEIAEEIEKNANQEFIDLEPETETEEIVEEAKEELEPPQPEIPKPKRNPADIKTLNDMVRACFEDFELQPKQVMAELGVSMAVEISESPQACYTRIASVMAGRKAKPEPEPEF